MKTIGQILKDQERIIMEMEQYFQIQDKYFAHKETSVLEILRIQAKKIKQMIADNKKPSQSLR